MDHSRRGKTPPLSPSLGVLSEEEEGEEVLRHGDVDEDDAFAGIGELLHFRKKLWRQLL